MMKSGWILLSFMLSVILYADGQAQVHTTIKDYNAQTDKQAVKELLEDNWYQLCGGYVHGYREPLVDQILDELDDFFKILYCDDIIVGFVIYSKQVGNRVHVETLAINKNYRNQGLGSILLQHVFDTCEILHIDYITIDTMLRNEKSRKLYEHRFGFMPLYLKTYKNSELNQESDLVISLGRAIDPQLWDEDARKAIVIADAAAAQAHEYRITDIL